MMQRLPGSRRFGYRAVAMSLSPCTHTHDAGESGQTALDGLEVRDTIVDGDGGGKFACTGSVVITGLFL